jgi:hypothetical protein
MNDPSKQTLGTTHHQLIKRLKTIGGFTALIVVLLATGCSTAGMKGTPFYTGEYGKRQGPAEQRINVWPAFYYREPALSVLWPVFELTDDHAAVRPLFSVYGLDRNLHEYNVLWPLAQFDQRSGNNRIFPLCWGEDYRVLFPFYWHYDQPWGAQGGLDSLFPLWWLDRKESDHFNLSSPWPLVHVWSNQKRDANGSMVFPLYWHKRVAQAEWFGSPLWWSAHEQNGDYWRLLPPLYYEMANGDAAAVVTPFWSQGHSGGDAWRGMLPLWLYRSDGGNRFDLSAPWPLVRVWSDRNTGAHGSRVLPLYWQQREAGTGKFYSMPWSSGSDPGGYWRFLTPLYYQASNALSSTLITPLWAQGRVDTTKWDALVSLWYCSWDSPNRFSLYTPLAHFWSDTRSDDHGSTVWPLYWQRSQKGGSQFTSLLWFSRTEANGDCWRLLPPLFYQESGPRGSMLVTPLWAQGESATNDWAAIIPFGYWDRRQHTVLSPLWAHWRQEDTETWLAPWALSWQTRQPERSDFTCLGGLAHASWGAKPGASYLFPMYYQNAVEGTLLSPVWLRWRDAETQTDLAPWLLSWRTHTPERSDLWMAGGLARASWGKTPGADYVFPLFYHEATRLLTPLFGWDEQDGYRYFATPLAGARTGSQRGSWVFPLYSHKREQATGNVKDNLLLLGGHTKTKHKSRSWFIPFYYYQNLTPPDSVPDGSKRYYTSGPTFWSLPFCWYRNQCHVRPSRSAVGDADNEAPAEVVAENPPPSSGSNAPVVRDYIRAHGVFPLWSHATQATPAENRSNCDTSVLLWLYDFKHSVGPRPGAISASTSDYTRSRVLWRLWHYEKLNGAVSVDVFPSFTYDRKPDGFKQVSFLWRLFRYEHAADGRRKLDVLFVPLQR